METILLVCFITTYVIHCTAAPIQASALHLIESLPFVTHAQNLNTSYQSTLHAHQEFSIQNIGT